MTVLQIRLRRKRLVGSATGEVGSRMQWADFAETNSSFYRSLRLGPAPDLAVVAQSPYYVRLCTCKDPGPDCCARAQSGSR